MMTLDATYQDNINIIKSFIKFPETYDEKFDELFDILGAMKPTLLRWFLRESLNCDDSLFFIGYRDENSDKYDEYDNWVDDTDDYKTELYADSDDRINITTECGLNKDDPRQILNFIKFNNHIFKFIQDIGFIVVLHNRRRWRRGVDVDVINIAKINKLKWNSKLRNSDSLEIFVLRENTYDFNYVMDLSDGSVDCSMDSSDDS